MKLGPFQMLRDSWPVEMQHTTRRPDRPVGFRWSILSVHAPSVGRRLWIYLKGKSISFDFYMDRRKR